MQQSARLCLWLEHACAGTRRPDPTTPTPPPRRKTKTGRGSGRQIVAVAGGFCAADLGPGRTEAGDCEPSSSGVEKHRAQVTVESRVNSRSLICTASLAFFNDPFRYNLCAISRIELDVLDPPPAHTRARIVIATPWRQRGAKLAREQMQVPMARLLRARRPPRARRCQWLWSLFDPRACDAFWPMEVRSWLLFSMTRHASRARSCTATQPHAP